MERVTSYRFISLMILCYVFAQGCSLRPAEPQMVDSNEASQAEQLVHVVKYSGETLADIAAWYTGSSANWKELSLYSGKKGSSMIYLGDRIVIPSGLIVTRKPLIVRARTKKQVPKKVKVRKVAQPVARDNSIKSIKKTVKESVPKIVPREAISVPKAEPITEPGVDTALESSKSEVFTNKPVSPSVLVTPVAEGFDSGIEQKRLDLLKELMEEP